MKKCNRQTMIKILKEIIAAKETEPSQKVNGLKKAAIKDAENQYLEAQKKKILE
jgi:hypothetical protein